MLNDVLEWLKDKHSNADAFHADFSVIKKNFPDLSAEDMAWLEKVHASGLSFLRYRDDEEPDVVGQGASLGHPCLP